MNLNAPALIKYANDLIDKDVFKRLMEEGMIKELSELERGKLIVDFINKKNKPMENREFFKYFYNEQDKAEKLEIL